MAELSDLINFAINKSPVEFAEAFSEIVHSRAAEAIEALKVEVAASLYTESDESDDSEYEALLADDDGVDLEESYSELSAIGMGPHTKRETKLRKGVDYWHPKTTEKRSGEIVHVGDKNYDIADDDTGEVHTFSYYDPKTHENVRKASND